VFAQTGRRVLLVDADLRRPGVHGIFRALNTGGLTTLVLNDRVPPFTVIQATEQENLELLTSGPLPPNPAELTASNRMRTLLRQLADTYDLVVVDSAPLVVPDSAILSSYLDGTILVIDASRTGRGAVRHAREALAKGGGLVLGVVLNRLSGRNVPTYGEYYGPDLRDQKRLVEPAARGSTSIEAYKESSTSR
jgi:capsular exopolysaccharide synthesis family protein